MSPMIRFLVSAVVLAAVGAACGDDDTPLVFGDGVTAEDCPEQDLNPDGTCRTAPRPAEPTQGKNATLDCDVTDSMFFAPALGNGQADAVSAARSTLTGNDIGFDLEDTAFEERSEGEVHAVRQGLVIGRVSTVELRDGTWGSGHAEWCTEFESKTGTFAVPADVFACEDRGYVTAVPLQFNQAPTPAEAVERMFADPEYGPGGDVTAEEWEDGVTWIVRDESGEIVGAATPVRVEDGTWGLSEWTFCP